MYCSASSRGCPSSPGASGSLSPGGDGRRRAGSPPSPAVSLHQKFGVSVMAVLLPVPWGGQYTAGTRLPGRKYPPGLAGSGAGAVLDTLYCRTSPCHDPLQSAWNCATDHCRCPTDSFSNCSTMVIFTATSAIAGCVPADAENYIQQGPAVNAQPATVTDSIWWCGGRRGQARHLRSDQARYPPCEDIGYAFPARLARPGLCHRSRAGGHGRWP